MRLSDVMSRKVETIGPFDTPRQADQQMQRRRIRHLVVQQDGDIIGVITAGDVRSAEAALARSVSEIMSRRVSIAPADCTIRQAANLLRNSAAGALAVVDKGRLVGIVTAPDLLELIGRGAERPVAQTHRWVLRDRGVRPNRARAGMHR